MALPDILFYVFSTLMLLSGLMVLLSRNPVTSALFLVMSFIFLAGLYVLLEAYFVAAIQILVYAGAVMVLFIFIIMLLDIKASVKSSFTYLTAAAGGLMASLLGFALWQTLKRTSNTSLPSPHFSGDLKSVMRLLFTDYMLPFELIALLVLAAMIGVILLSQKESQDNKNSSQAAP